MAYYKIKNVTSGLAKRHPQKSTVLEIKYNSGFNISTHNLRPGQEIIIECKNIPVGLRNLRLKKLVTLREISENEFLKLKNPKPKKKVISKVIEEKKPAVTKKTTTKKKRTYTKKTSTTVVSKTEDKK